jgi:hypothetical protein
MFCLFLFNGTFTSFFKGKTQKEVTKQESRIQEAQKHMDPTDPDPQHCE